MKKHYVWLGAVLLLGLIIGGYLWWSQRAIPEPEDENDMAVALTPPPPTAPVAPPAIQHPLAATPIAEPLPTLEQSDSLLATALIDMLGKKPWHALFMPDRFIRRVVATVDNLPRKEAPVKVWPLRPVGSWLLTETQGDALLLAPANAERYAAYVKLIQSLDMAQVAALYRQFYPLFQQAYVDLGYPKAYFNDRAVLAIDDLLASPEPAAPLRLAQIKVFYQFADADLEQRSAGQKIMLRIGAENARVVKSKLRELRAAIVVKVAEPAPTQ